MISVLRLTSIVRYSFVTMTDEEWFHGFLAFCSLPPKQQQEHIRKTLEKRMAEWQEDPEPGRPLRPDVCERLLQQQQEVRGGERGDPLENFILIAARPSDYAVRILRNAARQLMTLDPEFSWLVLNQIQALRQKNTYQPEPLKGRMVGIF